MNSASLAILLGASEFPQAEEYPRSEHFKNTHDEFLRYLTEIKGIRKSELLDLFNSSDDASRQLWRIENFLDKCDKSPSTQGKIRDLFIVYIGHGILQGGYYSVAVRNLETNAYYRSALKIKELALGLAKFKKFRKFVFLDSCFAAAAMKEWGGPGDVVVGVSADEAFGGKGTAEPGEKNKPDDLVTRGTTIFCAADQTNVALSPEGMKLTMFGDAVLSVLRTGSPDHREYMSVEDIQELTVDYLREHHPQDYIRPVVHSPHQPEGDIRKVKIFENFYPRPPVNVNSEGNVNTGSGTQVPENVSHWEKLAPRIKYLLKCLLVIVICLGFGYSLKLTIDYVKNQKAQQEAQRAKQEADRLETERMRWLQEEQRRKEAERQREEMEQREAKPPAEKTNSKVDPKPPTPPTVPRIKEPPPKPIPGTWAQMDFDAQCLLWLKCDNVKFIYAECKPVPSKWDRRDDCK